MNAGPTNENADNLSNNVSEPDNSNVLLCSESQRRLTKMTLSPVLSQGYSDVKDNVISDTERSSGSSMSDDQPISVEKKNTNHEATDQEYKRRIEQYADMM